MNRTLIRGINPIDDNDLGQGWTMNLTLKSWMFGFEVSNSDDLSIYHHFSWAVGPVTISYRWRNPYRV